MDGGGRLVKRLQTPVPTTVVPRVTVVIPCYNYGHFLPHAVGSALSQRGVDVDVIIVDDCSTDGSQAVAADLAGKDDRIRVILHDVNRGHIRTYNHGLAEAMGDYVVLLSADDLLAPGALERSTRLMEAKPSVGLVYGYAPGFENSPIPGSSRRESWTIWSGVDWIESMCRRGNNIIVNPEAVMRRSTMDALIGYREDMPQAADMELWIRAASISDVGRVNGPAQAYYRMHSDNMHRTEMNGVLREAEARRDVFRSIGALETLPAGVRDDLVSRAMKKVALEAVREATKESGAPAEGGGTTSTQLMHFAADCDPAIRRSLAWKLLQLRRKGSLPHSVAWIDDALYQLVWSVRWRRWRRSGI